MAQEVIQATWKPNDEQIKYLSDVVSDAQYRHNISQNGYEPYKPLLSLLQDLKKLREE